MGSIHLVHSKDSESPYSTGHVKCVSCNSITDIKHQHDLARTKKWNNSFTAKQHSKRCKAKSKTA